MNCIYPYHIRDRKTFDALKSKILRQCSLFTGIIESGSHNVSNIACALETFRTPETMHLNYVEIQKQFLNMSDSHVIDFIAGFDRAWNTKSKDMRILPAGWLKGDDYYVLGQEIAFALFT